MKNKYLLLSAAVLIILFGYFLFKKQPSGSEVINNTVSPTNAVVKEATQIPQTTITAENIETTTEITVSYTNNGFNPKEIRVKKETTVIFENQSDKPMWIASAKHPSHLELPGFDQLESVAKGGKYSYTFVKAGKWGYHNHLGPSDFGVVQVD